jgi:hypothetical protein
LEDITIFLVCNLTHSACYNGSENKLILNESNTITTFPHGLGGRSIKYLLDQYFGLCKPRATIIANSILLAYNCSSGVINITTSVPKFGKYGNSNPRPGTSGSDLPDFHTASPELDINTQIKKLDGILLRRDVYESEGAMLRIILLYFS